MQIRFARLAGGLTTIGIVNMALAAIGTDAKTPAVPEAPRSETEIRLLIDEIADLNSALARVTTNMAREPTDPLQGCNDTRKTQLRPRAMCSTALRSGCAIYTTSEAWPAEKRSFEVRRDPPLM